MGGSEITEGGFDKRTLGEDNFALMRALGFTRFLVVGHDFGGSTAYNLAALHPSSVRRLVLIECAPSGLLPPEEAKAAGARAFGPKAWFAGFNATPELSESLLAGREGIYLNWLYDNFSFAKGAITSEDRARYVAAYAAPGRMHAALTFYRVEGLDLKNGLELKRRRLTMLVLCLGGNHAYGDTTLRALRYAATDVRGEVYRDCGHFVPEKAPERLIRSLLAFFGRS